MSCSFLVVLASSRAFPVCALHDSAASAALRLLLALHLELAAHGASRATCAIRAHLLVESSDFANNVVESLVDIPARLGRRLDELASELSC